MVTPKKMRNQSFEWEVPRSARNDQLQLAAYFSRVPLSLLHQLAKPAQRDRSLPVIHFVPTTESPDSHSIESGSLD